MLINKNILIAYFSLAILTFDQVGGIRPITVWIPTALLILILTTTAILNLKIEKCTIFVAGLSLIWVLYALPFPTGIVSKEHHLKGIIEYATYVIGLTLMMVHARSIHVVMEIIARTFLIFFWVAVFIYVLLIMGLDINGEKSFSSVYLNRNQFSTVGIIYIAFILFLPAGYLSSHMRKYKLIYIIVLILMIIIAASTKGLVGLFFVAIVYLLYNNRTAISLPISALLSVIFITLSIQTNIDIAIRFQEKIASVSEADSISSGNVERESGQIRIMLALQAYDTAKNYPLKGVGVNNAQFYTHNPFLEEGKTIDTQINYMEMLLNAGVIGFFAYYLPILYIFFRLVVYEGRLSESKHNKQIRYMLISLIGLKLIWDFGMKSYNDFHHVFLVCFVLYIYFKMYSKFNSHRFYVIHRFT